MGLASARVLVGESERQDGFGQMRDPGHLGTGASSGLVGLRVKNALFPKPSTVGWNTNMSVSDASTMTGAWLPLVGSGLQSTEETEVRRDVFALPACEPDHLDEVSVVDPRGIEALGEHLELSGRRPASSRS